SLRSRGARPAELLECRWFAFHRIEMGRARRAGDEGRGERRRPSRVLEPSGDRAREVAEGFARGGARGGSLCRSNEGFAVSLGFSRACCPRAAPQERVRPTRMTGFTGLEAT